MTKDYRYRVNLVAEKLMQIIAPTSQQDGKRATLLLWLKDYVDSKKPADRGTEDMTRSEKLASQAYEEIAIIIREASDTARWSEVDVQGRLDSRCSNFLRILEKHVALIDSMKDLVPAFSTTLHALYTAYEAATTALNFSNYLSKSGKDVYEIQGEVIQQVAKISQRLLQAVLEKSRVVKTGLDEGGWIDKVLESVLPEDGDETKGVQAIVVVMRNLVEENFLEEWAGLVVESWRDSVVGLSLLKPVKS
jgi:N-terminal acetyltransferase B complex non-catalytic subunit